MICAGAARKVWAQVPSPSACRPPQGRPEASQTRCHDHSPDATLAGPRIIGPVAMPIGPPTRTDVGDGCDRTGQAALVVLADHALGDPAYDDGVALRVNALAAHQCAHPLVERLDELGVRVGQRHQGPRPEKLRCRPLATYVNRHLPARGSIRTWGKQDFGRARRGSHHGPHQSCSAPKPPDRRDPPVPEERSARPEALPALSAGMRSASFSGRQSSSSRLRR